MRPSPSLRRRILAASGLLVATLVSCGDSVSPPAPEASVCGDGIVSGEEVCDDGTNDFLAGGCFPGCRAIDRSDEFFENDLLEISIETAPTDWDALRFERKSRHTTFLGVDCRSRPVENPYNYIEGTVTIDGVELAGVGLRKKGHLGSQSTTKPSLKVDLGRYQPGQTHSSLRRFALNNSKSDASHVRTCLSYSVFAAAGLPAPRCTFAHVTINGEDKGVFVAVEEVRAPFLRRHYDDPTGNLYEGTACDFRDEFFGGFEQETNNSSSPDKADLAAVFEAVRNPAPGLAERLAPLVDLDEFYRFWAAEVLVAHRDGYSGNANNYFVYADPSRDGKLRFVPWGPDATFRTENRATVPANVYAFSTLTSGLYAEPASRAAYLEALESIRQTFDADLLVAEADRIAAIIEPKLRAQDRALFATDLIFVQERIQDRGPAIDLALEGEAPDWTAGLRTLPCRVALTDVSVSFTATWDSLGTGLYSSGSATIDVALDGQSPTVTRSGARAGTLANGVDRVQVGIETTAQRRFTITASLPDTRFFEPFLIVGIHPLVSPPLNVTVTEFDISVSPPIVVRRFDIGEGTWTWTEVSTTPGGALSGSFAGTLYER